MGAADWADMIVIYRYGYGGTVPTARNIPGQRTVPLHRHSPDTLPIAPTADRLIRNDDHSDRRQADQMVYQASGDYGKFTLNLQSDAMKLKMQPLNPSATRRWDHSNTANGRAVTVSTARNSSNSTSRRML